MMIRKSQIIFYSCLSFIFGVGIASFIDIPWLVIYFIGLANVILIILSRPKSLLLLLAFCSLFFALGIFRYQLSIPAINENHIAFYNGQTITFQGIVNDEPDARKDHVKYKVKSIDKKGNVLVKASLFPQYQYGDALEIKCKLSAPEPIEDFRYDKYLALSNVYSACYRGRIEKINSGQGNFFKTIIFKIKNKVIAVSGQILPEPPASFLGGLLWGAKKGLPEDILENFKRTGVSHIIAVSGYNITIIAVALTNLFIGLGLSRQKAFLPVVSGIVFFVVITGSPASIIRAGIMGVVALISQTLGRAAKMHHTLAIVGFLMLVFNPKVLIWDAGFQLSFLSTLGLIYFSPVLAKYAKPLPSFLSVKESLTTTLSAIIFTAPLILFQFGRFSIVAPIANLLILPAIPLNMAVGFLAVVLGLIWLPAGQIIGYGSWVILTYVLKVAEMLAHFSWSQVAI